MKKVNLSDSEWFIMNALWNKPGLELKEITNSLEVDTGWNSGRIRTMLLRLMDKGAVSVDKTTGVHKYFPSIERERCLKEESILCKEWGNFSKRTAGNIRNNSKY